MKLKHSALWARTTVTLKAKLIDPVRKMVFSTLTGLFSCFVLFFWKPQILLLFRKPARRPGICFLAARHPHRRDPVAALQAAPGRPQQWGAGARLPGSPKRKALPLAPVPIAVVQTLPRGCFQADTTRPSLYSWGGGAHMLCQLVGAAPSTAQHHCFGSRGTGSSF